MTIFREQDWQTSYKSSRLIREARTIAVRVAQTLPKVKGARVPHWQFTSPKNRSHLTVSHKLCTSKSTREKSQSSQDQGFSILVTHENSLGHLKNNKIWAYLLVQWKRVRQLVFFRSSVSIPMCSQYQESALSHPKKKPRVCERSMTLVFHSFIHSTSIYWMLPSTIDVG